MISKIIVYYTVIPIIKYNIVDEIRTMALVRNYFFRVLFYQFSTIVYVLHNCQVHFCMFISVIYSCTQREILGFTDQSFFVKIVFTKILKFS